MPAKKNAASPAKKKTAAKKQAAPKKTLSPKMEMVEKLNKVKSKKLSQNQREQFIARAVNSEGGNDLDKIDTELKAILKG